MWQQIGHELRASLERVLTRAATLVPAVSALVLAILLFSLLGLLLAFCVRRLLQALRFDERIKQSQSAVLMEWTMVSSPSLMLARLVLWSCVVIGAVVGISAFGAAYGAAAPMYYYVANIVRAVLILLAGTVAARFLARSVLISAVNMNLQYARLLSQGVRWLVLVLTVAMTLEHLGLGGVTMELAFGILFGGIVLTLALAIGLGSKELVSRSLEEGGARHTESNNPPSVRHF